MVLNHFNYFSPCSLLIYNSCLTFLIFKTQQDLRVESGKISIKLHMHVTFTLYTVCTAPALYKWPNLLAEDTPKTIGNYA